MIQQNAPKFDKTAFIFAGGGALGAYQVGIFHGLTEQGYHPDWLIGTSMGAINCAIIAGNKPEDRMAKLEGFWNTIATKLPPVPNHLNNIYLERIQHMVSASITELLGQPGFFRLRDVNPWFSIESTADKLSYYDTTELRNTLLQFIDFDLIKKQEVRLSMGAVHVVTGALVYFDNTKIEITVDHVMASAAIPPAFPAICIDKQFYWDGGVHSNTQINLLLTENEPLTYLCFMVNLFDSYGTRPTNMDDVLKRQKDITYSSHHRQSIQVYRQIHNLRHAIKHLSDNLSPDKKKDPELEKLMELGRSSILHVVRFHTKGKISELSSKDFEFSLPTIHDRIEEGKQDVCRIMQNMTWKTSDGEDTGLVLYEICEHPVNNDNPFECLENYHLVT